MKQIFFLLKKLYDEHETVKNLQQLKRIKGDRNKLSQVASVFAEYTLFMPHFSPLENFFSHLLLLCSTLYHPLLSLVRLKVALHAL